MSELNKTTIFFVVALVSVTVAVFTNPSAHEFDVDDIRGDLLFEEFPTDAPKRLQITTRSEETGDLKEFEVAEIDGLWSIPSRSGYPADATQQMAAAVEGVVDRKILDVINAGSGDHVKYGVVDPLDATADEGFGTHVQLTGTDDKVLADLIIGKPIEGRDGQYYVRKEKQDVVYQVEVDLDKFSTDFGNWIEKDLLGLNPMDVSQVYIDDYSSSPEVVINRQGQLEQRLNLVSRARMRLTFDEGENKWEATSLEQFNNETETYEPFTLAENQTINEDTLRELKNALDDLVIVDVEKKPDGLSTDLKAGDDFINSRETVMSLARRGFLATADPNNPAGGVTLLSSEGEIVVTQKNGVEYVLRFGDLQLDADAAEGEEPAAAEVAAGVDEGGEGLNRFLFVMARFNESAIEKPTPEELPELPAEEETTEDATEESAEETSEDEASGEQATEGEAAEPEPPKPSREEIEAERERIKLNNQRAQDEYNDKVEAGKKAVEELNERFGDWYYVIPNDVFKQVHLGRDQVITTPEPAEGAQDAAGSDSNQSLFGNPGAMIPGLPNILSGSSGAEQPPAEQPEAEQPTTEQPEASEQPEMETPAETEPAPETESETTAEAAEAATPAETDTSPEGEE